jgi:hypothetical protein
VGGRLRRIWARQAAGEGWGAAVGETGRVVKAKGGCGLGADSAGDVCRVRESRRVWPLVHTVKWKGKKRAK